MSERDVEKNVPKDRFIETLRRVADALEKGEAFRIQIANERIKVPANCQLMVEHERDDDEEEVELQFRWKPKSKAKAEGDEEEEDEDDDGDEEAE